MLNALTIDLEDWAQSVVDPRLAITSRVVDNVWRLLDLLDGRGVRATFFALGRVCEQFEMLLPRIASAGQEIGSHGYGHELVYRLTPEEFAEDVERSVGIIQAQTGIVPIGYRAPGFSITRASLWAGPVLARLGFAYDSSIFPIAGGRYGIDDAPRFVHGWNDCDLIEFPITTLRRFSRNWPIIGGGYTRLLPGFIQAQAIVEANLADEPAVVYLHPYELSPGEVGQFRRDGIRVGWTRRVSQSLFRSCVRPRLEYLLERFAFGPMARVLQLDPGGTARSSVHRSVEGPEELPVPA